MKTNTFNVQINAPKERVWEVLWNDDSYRQWTAVFHEGSYAKSDWEEGGSIQFLSPKGDGMYSRIQKKVPNSEMIFEHLGEIKEGVEQPQSEWAGARECYFLSDNNGVTELKVEVDVEDAYADYFKDTFPKALEAVKRLAEAKVGETI